MRILVPTDYSAAASNAVRYAIQFAQRLNAQLIFFHLVRSPRNIDEYLRTDAEGYTTAIAAEEARLSKYITAQHKRLSRKMKPFKMVVRMGSVFDAAFMEALRLSKADIVIMGTHGTTNLRDRLIGSNTAHVIGGSQVPVLAVPARSPYVPLKKLVYFTDLEKVQEEFREVKRLAKLLKLSEEAIYFDYGWARTPQEEQLLKRLGSRGNFTVQRVSIEVPVLEDIRKVVRGKNDLICLYHDKKNFLGKLLSGSNAEEAPQKIHRPILSLQRK